MENIAASITDSLKHSVDKLAKATYIGIFNAFIISSILTGIAPTEIELFNVGFKIPILLAPVIIMVVNIVLVRAADLEIRYLTSNASNIMFQNNGLTNSEDAVNATNKLLSEMLIMTKPNLVGKIGIFCSFMAFHYIAMGIMQVFFPEFVPQIDSIILRLIIAAFWLITVSIVFGWLYFGNFIWELIGDF